MSAAALLVVEVRSAHGGHGDIGDFVILAIAMACVSVVCAVPFLILFCFKGGRGRPAWALLFIWLLLVAAVLFIEHSGDSHPTAVTPPDPASSP
jgi:hypothetical protein